MPELIHEKKVTARKQHTCDFCCQKINKGEQYSLAFLKFDDVYSWKSHLRCDAISGELTGSGYVEYEMTAEIYCEAVQELYDCFVSEEDADMEEMTRKLSKIFETHNLKSDKPNGYTVGYKLVERLR